MPSGRPRRRAIVCRYLSFKDPRLKITFRLPLVHIRLRLGDNSIRTDALVDSGATATFIPLDIMNMLGLDLKSEEESEAEGKSEGKPKLHEAVGAGGSFKTYEVEVDSIEVLKSKTPFCTFPKCKALVPTKRDAIPHAVLGRDTIFQKYDITYREHKQQVVFRVRKH